MTTQTIDQFTLANGLTVLVKKMADVQSAAFSILLPAGSVFEPDGRNGTTAIACDWSMRGAGERDSRRLSFDLDNLGVQRHESVSVSHTKYSGATLADNLSATLQIYGDVLLRPSLPDDQFDAVRAGIEQSLLALEDEPRQKVFVELRRRCFEQPWGRPSDGSLDELGEITRDDVRGHFDRTYRPNGAVLGIAGNVDCAKVRDVIENVLGDWKSKDVPDVPDVTTGSSGPTRDHIPYESTQTQIGIAWPSVPYQHERYYDSWAAVSVLSGGMSSRLFTEVREKRGLCYSIYATTSSLKHTGKVLCYAGTTSERAQETLDVTLSEVRRLQEGFSNDELERCKAQAKSSLIMQQESTSSRAGSIARDWYHLGRVTSLDEVRDRIESLTVDSVMAYLRDYPAEDFTILTIGPDELTAE